MMAYTANPPIPCKVPNATPLLDVIAQFKAFAGGAMVLTRSPLLAFRISKLPSFKVT